MFKFNVTADNYENLVEVAQAEVSAFFLDTPARWRFKRVWIDEMSSGTNRWYTGRVHAEPFWDGLDLEDDEPTTYGL